MPLTSFSFLFFKPLIKEQGAANGAPKFFNTACLFYHNTAIPPGPAKPVVAPAIVLIGATLPLADLLYTVMEPPVQFATKISLFAVSKAKPHVSFIPVVAPAIVLIELHCHWLTCYTQ